MGWMSSDSPRYVMRKKKSVELISSIRQKVVEGPM